jgi:CRP/FNR family transcriptional regulator, anaerobic regulatory protein
MFSQLSTNCITCNNSCLVKEVSDSRLLEEIQSQKIVGRYKEGQEIIFEGMQVHDIKFIYSGKVKVYKRGDYGKIQILRFGKNGNILGHRGINLDVHPISANAIEDTIVCMLPRQFFLNLLMLNNTLTYRLLMHFADELLHSETKERNLAQMSVREKIADALLYLKKQFGLDNDGNLDICLSRQDIADLAGTTKEQVSKMLSEFRQDSIIGLDKKKITIPDCKRLKAVASNTPDFTFRNS